jgi:hypothetical protein
MALRIGVSCPRNVRILFGSLTSVFSDRLERGPNKVCRASQYEGHASMDGILTR